MKFMRRPDIDTVARVHIAAQAFLSLGVYGEITRIAKCYRVSRLFVYKLLWPFMLLYDLDVGDTRSPEVIRKEVDRHILLLRFEGHCALERMAQILKQLGLPFASVGAISQRLAAYAQALPREAWTNAQIVGSLVISGVHNYLIFQANKAYPDRSRWIRWNKCLTFRMP